jgi:hypothetical protein
MHHEKLQVVGPSLISNYISHKQRVASEFAHCFNLHFPHPQGETRYWNSKGGRPLRLKRE